MKKVISDKTICFFDEDSNEKMYIDHSKDECILGIETSEKIIINEDDELYSLLEDFMSQKYQFGNEYLQSSKTDNKLIWYSDCYYNPDDEYSVANVSCLNIEKVDNHYEIWATKELDKMLNRKTKCYGICFSPCGNGQYTKNIETGLTLQDDFVIMVYAKLRTKNKLLLKK